MKFENPPNTHTNEGRESSTDERERLTKLLAEFSERQAKRDAEIEQIRSLITSLPDEDEEQPAPSPRAQEGFIRRHGKVIAAGAALAALAAVAEIHKPKPKNNTLIEQPATEAKLEKARELLERIDRALYEALPYDGQDLYIKEIARHIESKESPHNWAIIDKKNAVIYVLGKDDKVLFQRKVIVPRQKGDKDNDSTIMYTGAYGYMPPGLYAADTVGNSEFDRSDYGTDTIGVQIHTIPEQGIAIHGPVRYSDPKKIKEQADAFKSDNPEDRRLSHACCRVEDPNEIVPLFTERGSVAILTEDDPGTENVFVFDEKTNRFKKMSRKAYLATPAGKRHANIDKMK